MAFIQWNPSFSVNVKILDEQHQMLVKMINDLYDAMEQGQRHRDGHPDTARVPHVEPRIRRPEFGKSVLTLTPFVSDGLVFLLYSNHTVSWSVYI